MDAALWEEYEYGLLQELSQYKTLVDRKTGKHISNVIAREICRYTNSGEVRFVLPEQLDRTQTSDVKNDARWRDTLAQMRKRGTNPHYSIHGYDVGTQLSYAGNLRPETTGKKLLYARRNPLGYYLKYQLTVNDDVYTCIQMADGVSVTLMQCSANFTLDTLES